jgi:dienelactone hydrolase
MTLFVALLVLAAPPKADAFTTLRPLYEFNAKVPLEVRALAKDDFPTFTREKFSFIGQPRARVPAYLAVPKTGAAPFPVVLLIDGIGGGKERWFHAESWPRGLSVVEALVAQGFAVLALDAPLHGERASEGDFVIPDDWLERRALIMQSVVEHRRALDALEARGGLDVKRVGVVGLSIGALMAFILSAVEPRVKAAVAGLTPVARTKDPLMGPIAPQTFLGAITTPVLMFVGKRDALSPLDESRAVFEGLASKQKEFVSYDTDHRPPSDYAAAVATWLTKALGQSPAMAR